MGRARHILRSGAWLTRERIRLVAGAILFTSIAGLLYLLVTASGLWTCKDARWGRISPASTQPELTSSTATLTRPTTLPGSTRVSR